MELRHCFRCLHDLPVEQFVARGDKKGTSAYCRPCLREYNREYYARRTSVGPEYSAARVASTRALRDRDRLYVWAYLREHPCIDCGEPDIIVLEFDHRDQADKLINVSELVAEAASIKRIAAEIAKCDVLCANCHRRRTAVQMGWAKGALLATIGP